MRILLASEFYYPSVGGVQEVMRQLGERFAAHGHQVAIATTYMPERQSRAPAGVQIEEFRVGGNLVHGLTGEVERYQAYVLNADYDVLMVKAAQQWTFDALTPILDRITKPKVFVPCGFSGLYLREYADYFARMPEWLRKWDRLIFYATDYRDIDLARQNGIEALTIIPNGADEREFNVSRDPQFRRRMGIPQDAFLVLTVGSLTGIKGHHELARAFALSEFGSRPAYLILNGNVPRPATDDKRLLGLPIGRVMSNAAGRYRSGGAARLAKWIARPILEAMGLIPLLVRLGYVRYESIQDVVRRINAKSARHAVLVDLPRADLVQAYLNSDLFAFASKIEYSPLVLYEAAAAGLPFLSVPVGNSREIAEWTGCGVICPAPVDNEGFTQVDAPEFARQLSKLAAEPEALARLGANGRRNWEQRFTWDKISRMYEQVFEECIRSKAGWASSIE